MIHKIRSQPGMHTRGQLFAFIRDKQPLESNVFIESDRFKINVPIGDKDVMCMKVLDVIEKEYGDHTTGESIEMLMDTIWWLQTILIAFPPSGENAAEKHDGDSDAVREAGV